MAHDQQDAFAARRAALEAQFAALPPPGSAAYWQVIERVDGPDTLPFEVLARCLRERLAPAAADAQRIFAVIMRRIGPSVRRWAQQVASKSPNGKQSDLQQDLEQESYLKLWQELEHPEKRFILEHFPATFTRIRQHVAQDVMQKAGEWQRPGVGQTLRVPASQTDRLQAEPDTPGAVPLDASLADSHAQAEFERVELSDLLDLVQRLPPADRTLVVDRYWRDRTQAEVASDLGVTERTVRNRLAAILRNLGIRYRGGEEVERG